MTSKTQPQIVLTYEGVNHSHTLRVIRQAIFWISLPFGFLGFALPVYGIEIGAGAVQIGLFFSVFFMMTVLFRPLVGAGLDRFGRRPFFIAGLFGYTLSMFAFAYSDQVWGLVLARGLQGLAASFLWLATQAITSDVAERSERGKTFGSVDQSNSQGAIVGSVIGFSLLSTLSLETGWRALFIGYGLVGLWAAFMAWQRLQETQPEEKDEISQSISWSPSWILLLLVSAITAAAWTMVSPILILYLQNKFGLDVDLLALAYLPSALIWAFLPSRMGRLADRVGRKPMMVMGTGMAALTSLLIPHLASLVGLAIIWAIQALCFAAGDPAEQALVADLAGGSQRGRAYGLYATAAGIGASIGPLVGGWLYQNLGTGAPFYANGVVLFISTLLLAGFLKIPRTAVDQP